VTRARSFCRYCGALTANLDSCCSAHRDLVKLEAVPRDPLEQLPTMRAEANRMYRCIACKGNGILYPDLECDNCGGLGFYSALVREATQPTKGTGS
jgi:hypothetical protein